MNKQSNDGVMDGFIPFSIILGRLSEVANVRLIENILKEARLYKNMAIDGCVLVSLNYFVNF